MNIKDKIHRVCELLGEAANSSPESSETALSTLRAIQSSYRRACSQEPKSSAMARMTVCACAMGYVGWWLDRGGIPSRMASILQDIVAILVSIAPIQPLDHEVPAGDVSVPEGWEGTQAGPFSMPDQQKTPGRITMSRRPLLPGGDWTINIGGIPVTYAKTPELASERAGEFLALLSRRRTARPPVVRNPARIPAP